MRGTDQWRVGRARQRGAWSLAVGAALCAGLIGASMSPAWAASPADGSAGEVQLGSFALGDGLEGTIGELDGSFGFTLSAGGVQLAWDSRAVAADAVRLGGGWSFGLATIGVTGGVWVYPASGGSFEMDPTSPTGLAGYPGLDVVFARAEPGAVVPARADGSVAEQSYAFVLHELGGVSSYFDAAGYPVARLELGGERLDWRWESGSGRLRAVVTADGSVTALDWSDPSRVVIQPGSDIADAGEGSGVGGRWVVELDGGRVSAVTDPVGGVTRVKYDRQGLVERAAAPSGATTVVAWQGAVDGVARVERVRTVDEETGAEMSVREWSVRGEVAPSGWPLVSAPLVSAPGTAGSVAVPGFETSVSDGKTRVRSSLDGEGRMTDRAVVVSSAAGEWVVQEQSFGYPEVDGGGRPGEELHPTSAVTTYHDQRGGSRSVSESYGFDEFGRMVSRTAVDGSVVRQVFDEVVPVGGVLPVGLVVEETTTAPDGLVSSTRSEVDADRAAVIATEQWSGRVDGELVRTDRVETDVEAGFVVEERVFPGGDPAATPTVTRWSKALDLGRGTRTITQTVAAGTPIEASTVSVSSLVHGATLAETDAVGHATSTEFDLAGRQTSIEDAVGRSTGFEYRTRQAGGVNAVTVTDATGVAVTELRDVLGRVVRRSDNIAPSGRATEEFERVVETVEYDTLGVERVTDAWGAVTTTEHDVFGRTTRVTLPNGLVQLAEYDEVAGTATSGVSTSGDLADAELTATNTLDTSGRVTGTTGTRADGAPVPESLTRFDGFGREARSVDGVRDTATEYDVFGNPARTLVAPVAGAAGAALTAERDFDGFGVSVEKTLSSEVESSAGPRRELDVLGRVVAQTDQRGSTERTVYTVDGLVAEVVSDTGRVDTFEYDPVSRALTGTRVSAPDAAPVATAFRYDEAGRVIGVFDPADEAGTLIGYEYDDFGNVTRTGYPDGTEIRHEFDPHGRKTATIDAAGNRTAFSYDGTDGSLLAAAQTDPDGAPFAGVRYGYDEIGRVNLLERDNGVRTAYTFTSAAEIQSEVTTGPDGVQSEREYVYAPAGTLSTRIDRVRDETGQLVATRTDYEYDAHDRLIRSEARTGESPAGPVATRTVYEPTIGGDLATETVTTEPDTDQAVTTTRAFEYSPIGELVAISTDGQRRGQEFDPHGNLTATAGGARYGYDAAGRPVTQTTLDGVQIDTTYWADGSRREHTTQTGATRYYWDGDRLLNDAHDTTDGRHGTASYLIGATRHARSIPADDAGPGTSYYGTDRHSNITDLTDHTGTITTTYAYTDYGVRTITGDQPEPLPGGIGELGHNPFGYAGEYTYRDGTQPLGPRIYDTAQARFTSKDDAPLANLYAYADLNPITNIDPTGRASDQDLVNMGLNIGGLLLAVIGAALFLTTPGILFTAFGVLGFALATGDAVLATVIIVEDQLKQGHFNDAHLEIASWAFFAGSIITGLGGVASKMTKRGSTKAASSCMELMDCTGFRGRSLKNGSTSSSRRNSHSSSGSEDELLKTDETRQLAAHLKFERWNEWLSATSPERLKAVVAPVGSRKVQRYVDLATSALVDAKGMANDQMRSVGSFLGTTQHGSGEAVVLTQKKLRRSLQHAGDDLVKAENYLAGMAEAGNSAAKAAYPEVKAMRREVGALLSKRGSKPSPSPSPSPSLQRQF